MILRCPRCHQKNRLPDDLVLNGEYLCRNCGADPVRRDGIRQPERPAASACRQTRRETVR